MPDATAKILGFDIYGTLINTHGVITALTELTAMTEGQAALFSQTWRDKQLEYSFRRGLMRRYADFALCTAQALDYSSAFYGIGLDGKQKTQLMSLYSRLPPYDDVEQGLRQLQQAGYRLFAFSNGGYDAVNTLLTNAALRAFFIEIISVESVNSFKPDPAVYDHFIKCTNADRKNAWLISSNPFDVIGALNAGMQAAWLKRNRNAIFDPWEITPTITINRLDELSAALK